MNSQRFLRVSRLMVGILLLILMIGPVSGIGQTVITEFEPKGAMPGKDVGWLPTEDALVEVMLAMASVTPEDYVVDLGSGDGRMVIAAAKLGARALGVEYNPDLVAVAKRNAVREGVRDRVEFIQADLFEVDFSKATVVTLFLRSDLNLQAAAEDPRHEARRAGRVKQLYHGRLGAGPDRERGRGEVSQLLLRRVFLGRPGKGGGHLEVRASTS